VQQKVQRQWQRLTRHRMSHLPLSPHPLPVCLSACLPACLPACSIQEGLKQARRQGDDKKLGMVASRKWVALS
jgi:hypothetical protein